MAMNLLQLRTPAAGPVAHLLELVLDRAQGLLANTRALPAVPDCTLALLRDPYRFVLHTCTRLGRDVFQSRLMLRRVVFMRGQDAAELLYNPELFVRAGAAPMRVQRTLFGRGGVQSLDGAAHRLRKALFMTVLGNPENVQRLCALSADRLRVQARSWPEGGMVDFYAEVREVLARAACAWAGVPLPENEVSERTAQLTALFDQASLFGPPHWRAWRQRKRAERWCMELIEAVRAEHLQAPEGSVLRTTALHRGEDGRLLETRIAAVELLNFLRPVVAVSVYAVFTALALNDHPECRERLQRDDEPYLDAFVQEVRRFYPFFPMVAARVRRGFEWKGFRFQQGARVMLDLYATNHDPRFWEAADVFYPERFFRQEPGAYSFVPQGGGDARVHHRCPGERSTVELMKAVTRFLNREISYELPVQNLVLNWQRLPALPSPYFLLGNVRPAGVVQRVPRRALPKGGRASAAH
jgi:fatty-acid peroxygenase